MSAAGSRCIDAACLRLSRRGCQRVLRGAQVLPQRCVQALVEKTLEVLAAAPGLRVLQGADIGRAVLWSYCNRRIAAADQHQIHQQACEAPIAVVERMNF